MAETIRLKFNIAMAKSWKRSINLLSRILNVGLAR
jgi:hypothetical protein